MDQGSVIEVGNLVVQGVTTDLGWGTVRILASGRVVIQCKGCHAESGRVFDAAVPARLPHAPECPELQALRDDVDAMEHLESLAA